MNEYRKLQREKKRGGNCIFSLYDETTKVERSVLCGCGYREPIGKKHNNRIVRRKLKLSLEKECE
ncbi:MAG: hypothetical protein WCG45_03510 [bacterium]